MENRSFDDELSLKELILTLIKSWKIITMCTIIALVLAIVYLLGIAKPIYESSVNGIINIPETVESKYGTYTFPSTNKMDYINLVTSHEVLAKTKETLGLKESINSIRTQVNVASQEDLNGFTITVNSDTPENAQILARTISDHLIDELSIRYKENAIEAFLRELDVKGKQLVENLNVNQAILIGLEDNLANTEPVLTLKKLITSNPTLAAEIANQRGIDLEDLSNEVMFEEYINPNYTELEAVVIETRNLLNTITVSIEQNNKYVVELNEEFEAMNVYRSSGDASNLHNSTLDILRSKISIQNTPSYSDTAVSPNKLLTLALALIIGLMIGVFAALFNNYWKTA